MKQKRNLYLFIIALLPVFLFYSSFSQKVTGKTPQPNTGERDERHRFLGEICYENRNGHYTLLKEFYTKP